MFYIVLWVKNVEFIIYRYISAWLLQACISIHVVRWNRFIIWCILTCRYVCVRNVERRCLNKIFTEHWQHPCCQVTSCNPLHDDALPWCQRTDRCGPHTSGNAIHPGGKILIQTSKTVFLASSIMILVKYTPWLLGMLYRKRSRHALLKIPKVRSWKSQKWFLCSRFVRRLSPTQLGFNLFQWLLRFVLGRYRKTHVAYSWNTSNGSGCWQLSPNWQMWCQESARCILHKAQSVEGHCRCNKAGVSAVVNHIRSVTANCSGGCPACNIPPIFCMKSTSQV